MLNYKGILHAVTHFIWMNHFLLKCTTNIWRHRWQFLDFFFLAKPPPSSWILYFYFFFIDCWIGDAKALPYNVQSALNVLLLRRVHFFFSRFILWNLVFRVNNSIVTVPSVPIIPPIRQVRYKYTIQLSTCITQRKCIIYFNINARCGVMDC